jgi:hypothetical protein
VDTANGIDEMNETNNTFILPLEVNASRDVTIENITFYPPYPANGDDVTITATVKNNGTKDTPLTFRVDLWMNLTRNSSIAPVPNANLTIEHEAENRTSYITSLKNTTVTLGPRENTTVNATWYNMNISGDPTYMVTAIVDALDEIDEINESQSDNELSRELIMKYPDLIVAGFVSPTREDRNASVIIENIGPEDTTNVTVTVRFEVGTEVKHDKVYNVFGCEEFSHPGAANMKIHFVEINAEKGSGVELSYSTAIGKDLIGKPYSGKVYGDEDIGDIRIEGDTFYICCLGEDTSVWIDRYWWGEIEDKTIPRVNASESVPILIPSQWDEQNYTQPQELTVTVDPDNNITELKDDNNTKTGTIYTDLTFVEYWKQVGKQWEYEERESNGNMKKYILSNHAKACCACSLRNSRSVLSSRTITRLKVSCSRHHKSSILRLRYEILMMRTRLYSANLSAIWIFCQLQLIKRYMQEKKRK